MNSWDNMFYGWDGNLNSSGILFVMGNASKTIGNKHPNRHK